MEFEFKDVLEAVGPTASLIFASWIFLTFLQSRYTAAYERYRQLIQEVREHDNPGDRHQQSVARQVRLYKLRCEQMRKATNIGVMAAMLLICAVVSGGLQVIFPDASAIKYFETFAAIAGLLLVLLAASFVVRENTLIQRAIDDEISDLPDDVKSGNQTFRERPGLRERQTT